MQGLRRHLTYANVMASAAVFIALGGASYAAFKLPNNSVKSKHIKNGQVKSQDVRDDHLTGADIDEAQLGEVPNAGDADLLDGLNSTAFLGAGDKAADADLLDGFNSSAFLAVGAKAADADKLDGQDSSAFLGAGEKAADADLLDGQDASEFIDTGISRISGAVSVAAGSNGTAVITCLEGEAAAGGGGFFETAGAGYIYSSRPALLGTAATDGVLANGWIVEAHNLSASPANLRAQAICAS